MVRRMHGESIPRGIRPHYVAILDVPGNLSKPCLHDNLTQSCVIDLCPTASQPATMLAADLQLPHAHHTLLSPPMLALILCPSSQLTCRLAAQLAAQVRMTTPHRSGHPTAARHQQLLSCSQQLASSTRECRCTQVHLQLLCPRAAQRLQQASRQVQHSCIRAPGGQPEAPTQTPQQSPVHHAHSLSMRYIHAPDKVMPGLLMRTSPDSVHLVLRSDLMLICTHSCDISTYQLTCHMSSQPRTAHQQ
jgi:hypothetical protein